MTNQRLGAAEWAVLIDQWRQSGLSLPAFCRQRGLSRGTMQNWVYKPSLKQAVEKARRSAAGPIDTRARESQVSAAAERPAFLPVRMVPTSSPPVSAQPEPRALIEIILDARRRVVVRPGFDPQTLRQVIRTLESDPC
jgi:hypothetical protein